MTTPAAATHQIPAWLRLGAVVWLVIWIPAYWRTWGAQNFVHLCDVAVVLVCAGLLTDSTLLISSQAVGSLLVDLAWILDAGFRLLRGRGVLGSTDYLFDANYPLWVRLLTLFHVAMPVLLLWMLARTGYDRRGLPLQCGIALVVFVASRFTSPAKNINYVFTDTFFHHAWRSAPVHVLVSWLFMVLVVYLPTHLVLRAIFRKTQTDRSQKA